MKFSGRVRTAILAALLLSGMAWAKDIKDTGAMVDSGSFGVFVGGRRVATETFSVQQGGGGVSTVTSQVKEDGGSAAQHSELQVSSAGGLVRYEWHETTPGKSQLELVPNNDFLIERLKQNPAEKATEHPFLMPATTVVLDNNFFVHREVMAWRYLASSCNQDKGQMKCGPAQFGVVVPQEQVSVRITVQPVGPEKVTIRGAERQLLRLNVTSDDGDWGLWLDADDHYKLVRVVKTGENTEVIRD